MRGLRLLSDHVLVYSDNKTPSRFERKAFTLIELLVVIAVIALLMAIIIPALKLAKQKAAKVVSLANVRQLTACWYMYQDENKGEIVDANPGDAYGWVKRPIDENGFECDAFSTGVQVTDEDEQRGIREGVLYPYVEAVDVYHCPADNVRKSKWDTSKIFRTYAIAECLRRKYAKKFSNIKIPSQRYNFVEEAEGKNWNVGGWYFFALNDTNPTMPSGIDYYWGDPIAIHHGNSGILGFCDGHGESRKWADSNTVERVKYYFEKQSIVWYGFGDNQLNGEFMGDPTSGYDPTQRTDLTYMNQGWAYPWPSSD